MIAFTKMHGIGNDFVMLDGIERAFPDASLPPLARAMSDRRYGIGSDGIILVDKDDAGLSMRMWNPDGSESEMCGNGVRCFAKFVHDRHYATGNFIPVETGAGSLVLELLEDGKVRVDMGKARLTRGEIGMIGPPDQMVVDQPFLMPDGSTLPGTAVSMGNPHLVLFVDNAASVPLEQWGPALERNEAFPNRVNVHFAMVERPTSIVQRTWERGAGATLACGTGACAVGVAAFLTGRGARETSIRLPGGVLDIRYAEDGTVYMTGPAEYSFEGEWPAG
ncbi:MAG TPA: diaminopimelate epimerase [Fimbriimonadaceae bacterium]|nr:diaminopimelate epimerase [Fimbriimonadaceae bacterium]HRJ96774.1 diaminopimelate epimerase [Fimbriimonadaceae bacterium]